MGCGSRPFSLYADVRSSDDVIAFRRYDPNEAHWEMLRQIAPAGATQRYLRWKPPIDNDLSELKAKCSTILGLWTWRLARADMEESLKQGSIGQAQLQQLMWNLSEAQADVKVSHEATSVDAEYAAPSYDAYADVDCSTASKSKQKSKLKSKKRVKHRQNVGSKPTVVAKSRGGARKRATATAQANGADGVANEASKEARAEDDVVWYNSDVDGDDDDDIDGEVLETVGDATIHCLSIYLHILRAAHGTPHLDLTSRFVWDAAHPSSALVFPIILVVAFLLWGLLQNPCTMTHHCHTSL